VPHPFRDHPARRALRKLYDETDALLAHLSCDSSSACCRFGVTGREPYPTAVELAELDLAMRSAPPARARRLTLASERRCPLLGDDGRCRVYASRPFGCRTFYCERATGGKVPRPEIQRISREIADLSARFQPADPGPRALTKALGP
jgi:Fe-S-cluster containining protein